MPVIPIWLLVLLAGLANYKASHMVSQDGDDGPFNVFKSFRGLVGTESWFGKGVHCFSCVSFWGALVAVILIWPLMPTEAKLGIFVIVWGAVATIAFIVWRYFG